MDLFPALISSLGQGPSTKEDSGGELLEYLRAQKPDTLMWLVGGKSFCSLTVIRTFHFSHIFGLMYLDAVVQSCSNGHFFSCSQYSSKEVKML